MMNIFRGKSRNRSRRSPQHEDSRMFRVPPVESKPFFGEKTKQSAYRPASFVSRAKNNSNILDRIKDRPAKPQWPQRPKKPARPAVLRDADMAAKAAASFSAGTRRNTAPGVGKKAVSLTLPLLPVVGLLILGVIFVRDNRDSLSSLLTRDVVEVTADSGGEASMAAFAGAAVPSAVQAPSEAMQPATVQAQPSSVSTQPSSVAQPLSAAEQPGTVQVRPLSAAAQPPTVQIQPSSAAASQAAGEEAVEYSSILLTMIEYFLWDEYTVQRGDSVSSIAVEKKLTDGTLIAFNNLTNAHLLQIGQKLRIPNMNGIPYVVKKGDNLTKIANAYDVPVEVIADVNDIQQDILIPGQNLFLPGAKMAFRDYELAMGTYFTDPLKDARISSNFGWREYPFGGGQRFHEAIDMAIAEGTPVRAASGGTVSVVGTSPVYGKYIILEHGNNFQTLYAHLSAWSVKKGDTVKQGGKIGEVGSTGLSTGPHLHFSVYKNGNAVDPLDYFTH